jgi:hypothetical protein
MNVAGRAAPVMNVAGRAAPVMNVAGLGLRWWMSPAGRLKW